MNAEFDDDTALLLALKNGDHKAYETLYNKYKGLLYVHAYKKLKDREQVKDIIHEIFLSLWEKRSSLTITVKFSSYLYQAVRPYQAY